MNRHEKGRDNRRRLLEIASEQQGYFSAPQAVTAGYATNAHSRYVAMGEWERIARGVFRLSAIPAADRPDLVVVGLWSRDQSGAPQAVVSHASAASLWELGDFNPTRLEATVPEGFRRRTEPPYPVTLHQADVPERDIETRSGYRLTRPLRTILDLLRDPSVPRAQTEEAYLSAVSRAMIAHQDQETYPMSDDERAILTTWYGKR